MEKDDYFTDRKLVESLLKACEKEFDEVGDDVFEKEYWWSAIKGWKKILTEMRE